jgi:hypothetical protein
MYTGELSQDSGTEMAVCVMLPFCVSYKGHPHLCDRIQTNVFLSRADDLIVERRNVGILDDQTNHPPRVECRSRNAMLVHFHRY